MFEQQGFEYDWPDINSPLFMSKMVLTERNFPIMAIASRLTAEEYFLMDKTWGTPVMRWQAFLKLHEAARIDLYGRGLEDCYCWVPPEIEKSFGRKLFRIGWEKNVWRTYQRQLSKPTEDLKCVSIPESATA
jgi:hypothetical protein